ncbi:MAG: hypothetical protein ABEI98_11265 [Halorhabdus sp.]
MDSRFRYGLGVLLLGMGNVAVGFAGMVVDGQSTVSIGIELLIGVLLSLYGGAVISDPERVDPEQLSPRLMRAIGWVGIVLGAGMLVWTVATLGVTLV